MMDDMLTRSIKPLIQQHARDAVFYWQQINTGCFSPLITTQKRHHFHRQLNAHLDGLRVAGQEGWDAAFKNYARWKAEGEAFICWLLALEQNDKSHITQLQKIATGNTEPSLRGMTEAISWLPKPQARLILAQWHQESASDNLMLEAWLRASAGAGITPPDDLHPFLAHPNPRIRTASCELTGKLRLHTYQQTIVGMLSDDTPDVREAALMALAWLSPRTDIVDGLHELLLFHLQNAPQRGLAAIISRRKQEHIARMTGLCLPQGDPRLNVIIAAMPERLRLLTLAYHGDPTQLSVLYNAMKKEHTARLAFWATGFISGLDMTTPERCIQESATTKNNEQPLSFKSDDTDIGLVWPNVPVVIADSSALDLPAGPLILGNPPSATWCNELLSTATQAARFAASWHLISSDATIRRINIRD
ncbi:hypothetical protein ACSC89_003452 [Salmonella enterica subsp. enterica]|nr:hypothetical protein [Salmonella enterica]ECG4949257.1 hypothetical protein [Salmonella enterica subsp. enterica serovar Llandoff]ECG5099887.1 hypothetical protein [Salmonella enterica subsp. enterica]EEH9715156.1 hypothetical protein [Salmonella enterica subsp. enterica serovar Vancouver]EDR3007279.1 hypothetical protein [Salmonella enterica subsp. enterica]